MWDSAAVRRITTFPPFSSRGKWWWKQDLTHLRHVWQPLSRRKLSGEEKESFHAALEWTKLKVRNKNCYKPYMVAGGKPDAGFMNLLSPLDKPSRTNNLTWVQGTGSTIRWKLYRDGKNCILDIESQLNKLRRGSLSEAEQLCMIKPVLFQLVGSKLS